MASFSVEDDLDKVWSRTLEQCQDIAKWDLKAMSRGATVDSVISKIRPSPKEPELQDKAKAVLSKTLICVQRFGSIVAQAASAMFPGTNQVMGGISFLVNLTQDYAKIFSGFVVIMERISAFLGRMKVYLDSKIPSGGVVLDKRLRADVYEVLHHFILTLAHTHKLSTSKMARAKLMAGLFFFGDDQGVQSSLAALEVKIANVSRMEITVILQEVSEAARDVRRVEAKIDKMGEGVNRIEVTLQAEQERRLTKEQSDQNAQRLKELLKPDEGNSWTKVHGNLQSQIVQSTGSWLLDNHTSFRRWMDSKETTPNVFVLSGEEGYGKSCLSSAVVHRLLEKYPKGISDHRVAVAYYYFQRDTKERSTVEQALRDVLFQLTQYDTGYAKKIASATTESKDLSKPLDLWKAFVDEMRSKTNNTFYIVLDGVDEPDSETDRPLATIVQDLMAERPSQSQLQVRLFMSGRPSELQKIQGRVNASIPEVALGSRPGSAEMPINEHDIVSYIDSRIKNMDIFQTSANDEVTALQNRIPAELAAGVKGDFVRLSYKLNEISRCTRVRQIELILERANETREDAIKRQISSLNASLSKDEIEELNEILNWLLGAIDVEAVGWVDTECLEGVLLLKTGTPAVVSLAKQITSKYASLLDLDKRDFVTLVSDDIRQYLVSTARMFQQMQPLSSEVQVAEIAIVKRVIGTFCGDDLYKRFNFEAFFESLGGEKAAKIQIDERSVHYRILHSCLVVLCEKPSEPSLKSLREYARLYFVEHLRRIDKQTLDNASLKWVRTQLARLLTDPEPIDAWWNAQYFGILQDDWMDDEVDDEDEEEEDEEADDNSVEGGSDGEQEKEGSAKSDDNEDEDDDEETPKYMDTIADWLRDAPIDGIESTGRTWLLDALSNQKPNNQLFIRVLRRLAERWYGGTPAFETFTCVYRLYIQIYGEGRSPESTPSLTDIDAITAWARAELAQIEGDVQWDFRSAVTLKNCQYYTRAITSCEGCLETQPDHWRARLCMAEALDGDSQMELARDCYQKLEEQGEQLREAEDGYEELYWQVILPGLAGCHVALDNFDSAAETYQRVADHYFDKTAEEVEDEPNDGQYDYEREIGRSETPFWHAALATTKLISVWYQQKNLVAIRSLLGLLDRKDTGYTNTRLVGLVQRNSDDAEFHEQMRALVVDVESFQFLHDTYGRAVAATNTDNVGRLGALRYYHGLFIWVYRSFAGSPDEAFWIWTSLVETTIPDDADAICFDMRIKASKDMPMAILHHAKALGPGTAEAEAYIHRLEAVAERISSIIYDRNEDPELSIARYYHLAGDEAKSRAALKKRMRDIFQNWDESSSDYWEHLELAHTFTAIDDDDNALAAWLHLGPYPPDVETTNANGATAKVENTDDNDQASSGADESDDTESSESTSSETDATSEGDEVESKADTETVKTDNEADNQTNELSGWLNSGCDGPCGTGWSYVDNVYCCRDCLDVQFESECYPKLKAGLLDKAICDPSHSFLHVPAFDEAKWRQTTIDDTVEFGNKAVSRLEWLARIRTEWGVDRETLERESQEQAAATVIQKEWKSFLVKRTQTGLDGVGEASPA